MTGFRAIVFSAALAGLIVGCVATLAQRVSIVPLILSAEVFERRVEAAHAHAPAPAGHEHAAANEHAAAAWEPADGLERNAYTALFNIVEWIGFGLLLTGALVLMRRDITWREGFFWGLGAFIVFVIAPGLGLPPELPGTPAAELLDRQFWWAATVAATAVGLMLIAFHASPAAAVLAILIIVAPHLIGAPRLAHMESQIPEDLSHQFIVAVTLTALPCWALLGGLTGHFYRKFNRAA